MAATYTDPPATNRDWCRFLIDDTDTSAALFSDGEITAVLGEERTAGSALKYSASATLLAILLQRWTAKGKGIEEKQVSRLRIRYAGSSTKGVADALRSRITELRIEAAARNNPAPHMFKVL